LVVHETRLCEIYIESIYSIYDFEIHVFQKTCSQKYTPCKMHALQNQNTLKLSNQMKTSDN
jgi:hypothetical protein